MVPSVRNPKWETFLSTNQWRESLDYAIHGSPVGFGVEPLKLTNSNRDQYSYIGSGDRLDLIWIRSKRTDPDPTLKFMASVLNLTLTNSNGNQYSFFGSCWDWPDPDLIQKKGSGSDPQIHGLSLEPLTLTNSNRNKYFYFGSGLRLTRSGSDPKERIRIRPSNSWPQCWTPNTDQLQ